MGGRGGLGREGWVGKGGEGRGGEMEMEMEMEVSSSIRRGGWLIIGVVYVYVYVYGGNKGLTECAREFRGRFGVTTVVWVRMWERLRARLDTLLNATSCGYSIA